MNFQDNEVRRCEVCGDNDLEFLNGEVTCRACGTQCATQETAVVLDDTVQFRYLTQVVGTSQKDQAISRRKKRTKRLPWKLSEPFQLILMAQIHAIQASLRAPPEYFNMVVQLWLRYLKATGEGFLTDEERYASAYPYGWGPIYDPTQGREKFTESVVRDRQYERRSVDDLGRIHRLLDNQKSIQEMEFDEGEHPLSSSSSSSSDVSDLSSLSDDEFRERSVKRTKRKQPGTSRKDCKYWRGWCGIDNGWYLLEFNLALCYLPLLYMCPDGRACSLSTLLDLVRQQNVPYREARTVLSDTFCIRNPSFSRALRRRRASPPRKRMCLIINRLLDLLGMEELPRFPLFTLITQLVEKLRLPLGMVPLAKNLAARWLGSLSQSPDERRESFQRSRDRCLVCPDTVTMSFVLLLLSCIRGDDFGEALQRLDVVRSLRELTGCPELFLWTEWMASAVKFHHLGKTLDSIRDPADFNDLPNVGFLVRESREACGDGDEEEEDSEVEEGRGKTCNRPIQEHEHLLTVQHSHFVKRLMTPFQTHIERAVEQEESLVADSGAAREFDFRSSLLCYPIDHETVEAVLDRVQRPDSDSPPSPVDIFGSQDAQEGHLAAIKKRLSQLPTAIELTSSVMELSPPEPPADLNEVLAVCSFVISCQPLELWATMRNIQRSLIFICAGSKKKAGFSRNVTDCALSWRAMFNPS